MFSPIIMIEKYMTIWICVLGCAISVFGQQCEDCMTIADCPAAGRLLRTNSSISDQHLRNAFCGFAESKPRVCCSNLSLTGTLDQHPNLSLLPASCGPLEQDKIGHGLEAYLHEFPWMVLIFDKTSGGLRPLCGGSISNKRYILTAAHCITGVNVSAVRVGEHDLRTDPDCDENDSDFCESSKVYVIEEKTVHVNYDKILHINDIGLLRLASDIDFTPRNIRPVCLPVTQNLRSRVFNGEMATVSGWGSTKGNIGSAELRFENIPVFPGPTCEMIYKWHQSDSTIKNQLCAGNNGTNLCIGDSGGPLNVFDSALEPQRYIQYGILSYGTKDCRGPGVFTDVSKYMQWILDSIKE